MKLFRVILENYRQYCGTTNLEFSTSEQNITIIQGNNGEGKSNLMNAIVWCLFNDEMFKPKTSESRPIINEAAISSIDVGEQIRSSVTVILGDDKPEYEFIRSIQFVKTPSGRIDPLVPEFKGYRIDKTGSSKIADPEWEINKHFIPKDLRGFFFFDGEKMDQYFEDTSSVKTNVERISQIDVLNNVIQTVTSTVKSIEKEMRTLAPNSEGIESKYESLQQEKSGYEEECESIRSSIPIMEDERKEIDRYLTENSSTLVSTKSELRGQLTTQYNSLLSSKDQLNAQMRQTIANAIPTVYAYSALKYASELIEAETNRGTLPPNIKDIFLKELLEEGVCICGRSLDEDESCRKNIENLLKRIVPSDIANDATQGKYIINSILSNIDFRGTFTNLLTKQMKLDSELEEIKNELDKISDELSKYNEIEISEKEEQRRRVEKRIDTSRTRIGYLTGKITNIDKQLDELDETIQKNIKDARKYEYLLEQKDYANHLLDEFKSIKEKIITEVRSRLEVKTNEYFFNMIGKDDSFQKVRILDQGNMYKISVLSPEGAECLGDLSAGERQVLALSFTAALYGVSGYHAPVIIDTPLGRISGITRDKIASSLPDYLSDTQLIMTMTDTEYTDSVRNAMKTAVGNEYKIQYDGNTKTSKVVMI